MNDNELYHYGVLGMKWGVRKARPTLASIKRANKDAMDVNVGPYGGYAYDALRASRKYDRKSAKYQNRANSAKAGSRKALRNQYKAKSTKIFPKQTISL